MSIDPIKSQIVAETIQADLQGVDSETHDDFETDYFVVRVYRGELPSCEVSFAEEFLDDNSPEALVHALRSLGIVARLIRDPSIRLHVDERGQVGPGEVLVIKCNKRVYRITRGTDHLVRVYDGDGESVPRQPPLKIMESSIFRKSKQDWCKEIVNWL